MCVRKRFRHIPFRGDVYGSVEGEESFRVSLKRVWKVFRLCSFFSKISKAHKMYLKPRLESV